jgi:hypothetical protein
MTIALVATVLPIVAAVVLLTTDLRPIMRDWARSRRMQDPVRGEAQVVAATAPGHDAYSSTYEITAVVRAAGMAPAAVVRHGVARTAKWPRPGMVLPVTVDQADPTRIRIEWGEVPTTRQVARDEARRLAQAPAPGAATAGEPYPTGAFQTSDGLGTSHSYVVVDDRTIDLSDHPEVGEDIRNLVRNGIGDPGKLQADIFATLRAEGLDPDATAPHVEPAERLRRLDEVRNQGLVSETEYRAKHQRVVDEL